MKRIYSLLFAIALTIGVLAGCAGGEKDTSAPKTAEKEETQKADAAFPVTIKDATDQDVVIDAKPEKIVSLIPSNTEIAYELGLGEDIVGVSDYDNYPEEVATKEKIGGMELNIEKILSLTPDLVLAHASSGMTSEEGLKQLKDAGVAVLVVNDAVNFEQTFDSIDMIGKATGEQQEAKKIIKDMKESFDMIEKKAAEIEESKRKTVFVEVSPEPEIYTPGKNTFIDGMLSMIHANNASEELEGWVKIDQEAIIQKNPDAIVTTYGYYTEKAAEKVLARKGWQDMNAIKEKQVFDVHSDLVTRPGPRLAEGVEELAKAIYPEVFAK
jgi:iron complex transport system substrate-binding protein